MRRKTKHSSMAPGKIIAKYFEYEGDLFPKIYREKDFDALKSAFRWTIEYRGPNAAAALFKFRGNKLPAEFKKAII